MTVLSRFSREEGNESLPFYYMLHVELTLIYRLTPVNERACGTKIDFFCSPRNKKGLLNVIIGE